MSEGHDPRETQAAIMQSTIQTIQQQISDLSISEPSAPEYSPFSPPSINIFTAARNGDNAALTYFISNGTSPDIAEEGSQDSLLHMAALAGQLHTVQHLIKLGAKLDTRNKDGSTPLFMALQIGHAPILKELLPRDDPLLQDKADKALIIAAFNGHVQTVRELVGLGAKLESAKKNGETALFMAAQNGHNEVVAELVRMGARIDCATKSRATPMHIAAEKGHTETITTLIKLGARVGVEKKNGETPLHRAAKKGHVGTVRELLRLGAPKNSAKKGGETPLYQAAKEGHADVVKELIKMGAYIEPVTKEDGYTPLLIAVVNGHIEVIKTLIALGANVKVKSRDGESVIACAHGNKEIMHLLKKSGAPSKDCRIQ